MSLTVDSVERPLPAEPLEFKVTHPGDNTAHAFEYSAVGHAALSVVFTTPAAATGQYKILTAEKKGGQYVEQRSGTLTAGGTDEEQLSALAGVGAVKIEITCDAATTAEGISHA